MTPDSTALAYVNMFGVLGALEELCALDEEARNVCSTLKKPVMLCFDVKDGPCSTFCFSKDGCILINGRKAGACVMKFKSPQAFNALISDSKIGFPAKHPIATLSFMSGHFTKLTDRLNAVLRPDKKLDPKSEDASERAMFEENTLLTLYVIAGSISALANHDPISRQSAQHTVDGDVQLGVKDKAYVTISVSEHSYTTTKKPCEKPRAIMEFADLELANALFNGTASTINELCKGNIRLAGMLSMVDNINRILDRVSVYLQ